MSLHDAHLQQALKHAPDRDVVPDAATRREVLNYAAKATRKKSALFALRALRQSMSGWPLAGLGSAMAVMLVMVVFWDKHAAQTTFDDVAPRQVAQVERKVAQAENKAVPVSAAPTVLPEKAKIAVHDRAVAAPAAVAVAVPTRLENKGEVVASKKMADEKVAIAPEAVPVLEERANTDAGKTDVLPKARVAGVVADSKPTLSEPAKAVAPLDAIAEARVRGAANAANDIKAGILRILTLRKPADGEAIDALTGYRLEFIQRPLTDALQAEIDAYNQVMRERRAN